MNLPNDSPNIDPVALLDRPLIEFKIFSEAQLNALEQYAITTVGELLGATQGLQQLDRLEAIQAGLSQVCAEFSEQLPDSMLIGFTEDETQLPQTGLIPEEEDDGDTQ